MSKTPILVAAAIAAALAFAPVAALAADSKSTAKPATTQEYEKDADRHEPAEGTQQHKMKVCNVQAHEKDLHGDERRAFMSSCLRK